MSWLASIGHERPDFEDVFSLRPDLYDGYRAFYALFWQQHLVDPVLLEIARLRIARLNGCVGETVLRYRPAIDAGMSEAEARAVLDGRGHQVLDRLQLACLGLAEKFVLDVHSITDADVAAVREEIGEPALVALIEAMALFDGFTRFRAILGVEPQTDGGAVRIVDAPALPGVRS